MTPSATLSSSVHAVGEAQLFATAKRTAAGFGRALRFAGFCLSEHRHGRAIDAARAAELFSRAASGPDGRF